MLSENEKIDEKTPTAAFHIYCDKFQELLREGRLSPTSTTKEGAKVVVTIGGNEYKGTVILESPCGSGVYVDAPSGVVGNDRSSFVVTSLGVRHGKTPGSSWEDSNEHVFFARTETLREQLQVVPMRLVRRDPEWVKEAIKNHRPDQLPVFVNVKVFNIIVERLVKEDWRQPCFDLVSKTESLLTASYAAVVDGETRLDRYPRLKQYFKMKFSEGLEAIVKAVKTKVEDYLDCEYTPYSQNEDLTNALAKLRLQRFEDGMKSALAALGSASDSLPLETIERELEAVLLRHREKANDLYMSEEMESALSAYGTIAKKRFIDNVPMLCRTAKHKLLTWTEENVFDVSDDVLNMRMNDSQKHRQKYDILVQQAQDFQKALEIITQL